MAFCMHGSLPASIIVQLRCSYVLFAISTDLHKQICIRPVLVVFMFLVNRAYYFTATIDYVYNLCYHIKFQYGYYFII